MKDLRVKYRIHMSHIRESGKRLKNTFCGILLIVGLSNSEDYGNEETKSRNGI